VSTTEADLQSLLGSDAVPRLASPWLHEEVPLARPRDEAQVCELLRYAASSSKKVLPIGSGTKLGWTSPPEHIDFALTTRALTGVVAYEPGDGTLTARAGSTLSEIREVARAGGNHVTPDVPRPGTATLGGVLAAGQSGIDRTRHGPARHHILGMRVALADGTLARSGGRLVKNVTGFDLHRLYCGSEGSLCVIVEASLRLFPAPESAAVVRAPMKELHDALYVARSVLECGARPYSVLIENLEPPAGEWCVHVLLAGREEPVDAETDTVRRLLPGASVARGEQARVRFEALRDLEPAGEFGPSLHIGVLPSRLESALEVLERTVRAAGVRMQCAIQPSIATVDVSPVGADDDRTRASLSRAHWIELVQQLRTADLDVRPRNVPTELRRALDQGLPPHHGREWMRRLKRALDPAGVFVSPPMSAES
jgi:glycolate oxidase FAD binding subunit